MKTIALVVVVLIVSLGALPSLAFACRCVPRTAEEDFAEADAVFSGKVAAVTAFELEVHAFVDWLEVWKGDLPAGTLVRVVTADSTAACGYPFQVGEEVVIFAQAESGLLRTHTCTHTGRLTRAEARTALGPPQTANPLTVEFIRGDVNADGGIDISDAISSLLFLFVGGSEPLCKETLDFDGGGNADIADAIAELVYLFQSGPPPAEPFPGCGRGRSPAPVDCAAYPPCPAGGDRHEVVRIERIGDEVEVEVYSTRPFQPRALFPILCVGTVSTFRSRGAQDGSLNTLIFTFTSEELARVHGSQLVTVQHGDHCTQDLDQLRLYWDLWVFGLLEF